MLYAPFFSMFKVGELLMGDTAKITVWAQIKTSLFDQNVHFNIYILKHLNVKKFSA